MSLSERDSKIIWHPFTHQKSSSLPIAIVKGEGTYLIDENNTKYIDGIASWWVNAHGHCHPYIVEKIHQQIQRLEHSIFSSFTHEPAIKLAERLIQKLPANQAKIFYSDNGSTSVEVAMKMAIQYWHNQGIQKRKVVAFKNGYHGDTFGAMSVGARNVFSNAFDSFLFDVTFIDVPQEHNKQEVLKQAEQLLEKNDVAFFIFEPLIQGAGGMVSYDKDSLDQLIHICKKHQCITIADEVMTGFGRTGKLFATDYLVNKPDILCLSKALTGGFLPLGVTSCSAEIYDAYLSDDKTKTFFHGHSYTANATACAAALASLDLFEMENTLEKITVINTQHQEFSNQIKENKKIKNLRTIGNILAIELSTPEETNYLNPISEGIAEFFQKREIILRPLGNVLYLLPPYCITKEQLTHCYNSIKEFLQQ